MALAREFLPSLSPSPTSRYRLFLYSFVCYGCHWGVSRSTLPFILPIFSKSTEAFRSQSNTVPVANNRHAHMARFCPNHKQTKPKKKKKSSWHIPAVTECENTQPYRDSITTTRLTLHGWMLTYWCEFIGNDQTINSLLHRGIPLSVRLLSVLDIR